MVAQKNNQDSEEWSIDRRTVLKGTAAGAGIIGMSGVSSAGDGKPCHKDFSCSDEEGTYVNFEFIIETDDDGNIIDCYFEEETDTGLLEITSWESKEGEECEPIYVEWESDTHVATKVMAFGGDDCDTVGDPGTSYSADPEESDGDGLVNNGGNTAAISNLQFCAAEPEPQEILGTINLSYEDLPKDGSDWDVNDWVVDIIGEYKAVGTDDDDNPLVTEFTFDIVPQARGAGDDHAWHMLFPSGVLCGDGSYDLTVKDDSGNEISTKSDSGSFDGSSDVNITVFPNTVDVLADLENAELPDDFDGCTAPNEWATLAVEFDEPCAVEVPDEAAELGDHGGGLFFDPWLENLNKPVEVHQGDIRLVAVPDDWQWPLGAVQIWDAYDGVSEDGGLPSYDDDGWYLPENITNSDLVASCDFDPDDLGGS